MTAVRTASSRRILFLAGTLGVGGAERQLTYMLQVLRDGGHHVEVVTLEGGVFVERITRLGVEVTVLDRAATPLHRLGQVVANVRRAEPDVIQAAHNWVSAYAGAAGRLLRRPSIGAVRSAAEETFADVGRLGHLAFRLPPLLAVNSLVTLDGVVDVGVERARLVHLPNAVDTGRFEPVDRTGRNQEAPFTILGVGRFAARKRFDVFLEVVADVMAAHPRARAVLIGDGPERTALQAKAATLGLDDRLSWVRTDDPIDHYAQADLLVFTSGPGEGMPNVVLEAMATGLPVVAFESGDVKEVVLDGDTGRLIRPWGDREAMVGAVGHLIDDPAARHGLASRAVAHVGAEYSLTALARNLDRLHGRAMGVGKADGRRAGEPPSTAGVGWPPSADR